MNISQGRWKPNFPLGVAVSIGAALWYFKREQFAGLPIGMLLVIGAYVLPGNLTKKV